MKKTIIIIFICLSTSGCAAIGIPFIDALDFLTRTITDKGIVDHGLDASTGKNCRVSNLIKNKEVCQDDLMKKMEELDCDTFRFTEKGDVYCVETEK